MGHCDLQEAGQAGPLDPAGIFLCSYQLGLLIVLPDDNWTSFRDTCTTKLLKHIQFTNYFHIFHGYSRKHWWSAVGQLPYPALQW